MFYKFLLSLMVLHVLGIYSLIGQNSDADFKMPEIVPVSPEAKGLGKFGDVPVGTYTGTPSISIPIYTVKVGKLSLPITLSYHATGIEVSQEATWVGLGWNLVAGGAISYIPVGGHDMSDHGIMYSQFIDLVDYMHVDGPPHPMMKHEDYPIGWAGVSNPMPSEIVITEDMLPSLLGGFEEQDVYSANFLNYSFKFIEHPISGAYFFIGQKNKCDIKDCEIEENGHGFIVTGEDGIVYKFKRYESRAIPVAGRVPTSWLLTQMISPTGETITLKYKDAIVVNIPPLSESYTKKGNISTERNFGTGISPHYVCYLDAIETSNEQIVFESDMDRPDLRGAGRLKRIVIKDKINKTEKYSYSFDYSFFSGNDDIGGDYLNDGTRYDDYKDDFTDDNKRLRLKLDALTQHGNKLENKNYTFSYYSSPLPLKTSFATDHWGYYNGQENIKSLINGGLRTIVPNALPLLIGNPFGSPVMENSFSLLNGAIRGASENSAFYTAGMLKSIQYPTKGKTVFEYEPHDYRNYNYLSAEEEQSNPINVISLNATVQAFGSTPYPAPTITRDTFELSVKTCITLSGYSDFLGGALTIEGPYANLVYSISDPNPSDGHIAEWYKDIWLEPGMYILSCNTPPSYTISDDMKPEIWCKVVYGYNIPAINREGPPVGGGLRIKTMVNYDENNEVISSKKYTYVDENGNSSGLLIVPLQNFNSKTIKVGVCSTHIDPETDETIVDGAETTSYVAYTLHGSSYVQLSAFTSGNNVGYNRVVVESYNRNDDTNGKEILYYDNKPAGLYFYKIPFFPDSYNGNLLKRVILNTNGDTVLVEKNGYGVLPGTESIEVLNAYAESIYEGPTDCCTGSLGTNNLLAYIGRYNIYVYPTRNYFNTLTSKATTHYFPDGKVTEITEYTYDPDYFGLKSSSVTTSVADTKRVAEFKYPFDYDEEPYTAMTAKNILTPVVEKTNKINTTLLQSVKTNYKDWFNDNTIIAPETVVTTNGDLIEDERLVFGRYDIYGNVLEARLSNNITESYYYGYNNSLPVVKGVNIDSETLETQVQIALTACGYLNIDDLLKDIDSFPNSKWDAFNNNLQDGEQGYLFTTYTYDPVFGMTSQTDPNGKTIYYQYNDFGQLEFIRDSENKILKKYLYQYKK
jgi:hypothetical protein